MRAAIQDLDTQIEEQRLKIQNTPNKMLRVSREHKPSAWHVVYYVIEFEDNW